MYQSCDVSVNCGSGLACPSLAVGIAQWAALHGELAQQPSHPSQQVKSRASSFRLASVVVDVKDLATPST